MLFMHDLNSRGEDLAIEGKRVYNWGRKAAAEKALAIDRGGNDAERC
jgi:hypothetical protein